MKMGQLTGILLLASIQFSAILVAHGLEFVTLDTNGKFNVSWTHDDLEITFTLFVETEGWIGFGFSPNGAMKNSDIVTIEGFNVIDRHTKDSKVAPGVDSEQDWKLINGLAVSGLTTVQLSRKLKICRENGQDMTIGMDTMRLIYAWGSSREMSYHGTTFRGTKSLYLLVPGNAGLPNRPENAQDHEFVVDNYVIPAKDTTYSCTLLPMPVVDKKHHVIAMEPVLDVTKEQYVHHMLIFGCLNSINGSAYIEAGNHSHECYHPNMPDDIKACRFLIGGWAVGGGKFTYPAEAGFSIGEEGSPDYVVLEMHYDNPNLDEGVADNSGLRMTYTETLRAHDVDTFTIGTVLGILVPPGRSSTEVTYKCDASCTQRIIPPTGIWAFAGLLHSHLLGRKLVVRHTRADGFSDYLIGDHSYDFNFQETRHFPEKILISQGDTLQLTCSMGSEERSGPTYGGLATSEEMCLAFISYYPKIDLDTCTSVPIVQRMTEATQFYDSIGVNASTLISSKGSLAKATEYVNWSPEIGQKIEDSYFHYDHRSYCRRKEDFADPARTIIKKDGLSRGDTVAPGCKIEMESSSAKLHTMMLSVVSPLILLLV